MENHLPDVVLKWVEMRKISLIHLPDNSLGSIKKNAAFLRDLCGLGTWELGQLLFPESASKGSQQSQTVRVLNRGKLEEVVRVPAVLGFDPTVVFRKDLREKVIEYVMSLQDLGWEKVFSPFSRPVLNAAQPVWVSKLAFVLTAATNCNPGYGRGDENRSASLFWGFDENRELKIGKSPGGDTQQEDEMSKVGSMTKEEFMKLKAEDRFWWAFRLQNKTPEIKGPLTVLRFTKKVMDGWQEDMVVYKYPDGKEYSNYVEGMIGELTDEASQVFRTEVEAVDSIK